MHTQLLHIRYTSSCTVCLSVSAMCERCHQNNVLQSWTCSQASCTQNCRAPMWSLHQIMVHLPHLAQPATGVKNDPTTFFVINTSGTRPVHSVANYQHTRCTKICHSSPNRTGWSRMSLRTLDTSYSSKSLSISLRLAHIYEAFSSKSSDMLQWSVWSPI